MLRNESEAAVNDLVVAMKDVADGHEEAAALLGDDPAAALLRRRVAGLRAAIAELEELIRRRGDLPREPDADAEAARHLMSRLRASLAADERAALLDERAAAEERLAAQAAEPQAGEPVPPLQEAVAAIRREALAARARIAGSG